MPKDDRRQQLIVNLVAGMSKPEAARAAGYSESFCRVNVYEVTASADFQEELAKARTASAPASEKASEATSALSPPSGNTPEAQDTGTMLDMDDGLTLKERLFKDFYLGDAKGNGTLAAKLAGYSGSDGSLGVMAHHLLKKPKIKNAIRTALEPIMGADEVLEGLSQQARGSIADVLDDSGSFDLSVAKQRGTDGLLRKVKIRKRIERDRDGSETEFVDHDVEIHNSQAALELMGKHHNVLGAKEEPDAPLSQADVARLGEQLLEAMLEAAKKKRAAEAEAAAEGRALPPAPPNAPPVPHFGVD